MMCVCVCVCVCEVLVVPPPLNFFLQLVEQHNAVRLLEETVADASNPNRIRVLPGSDPTCQELRDKLEVLQVLSALWWTTRQPLAAPIATNVLSLPSVPADRHDRVRAETLGEGTLAGASFPTGHSNSSFVSPKEGRHPADRVKGQHLPGQAQGNQQENDGASGRTLSSTGQFSFD